MKSKKAISPLIATVLIIGFVIVLSALVITWGSDLFKKITQQTSETSEFVALCATGIDLEYTAKKKSENEIEVIAKNNKETNIYGFLFILKSDNEKTVFFSTAEDVIKSTENAQITPTDGTAILESFRSLTFNLKPSIEENWKTVEAKPILALKQRKKKVCESGSSLIIY